MNDWKQATRLARRELRGGTKGFRIFLACLVLGVATIAAVSSLNLSISDGLQRDGRILLGGDLDLRLSGRTATPEQQDYLSNFGTLSHISELRAMAEGGDQRLLVELKAVDSAYPLVGKVTTTPTQQFSPATKNGAAIVDQEVLNRLKLKVGDHLQLGEANVPIAGTLQKEPDRIASVINFGPRVLISQDTLAKTALLQPGSVVRHHYRLLFDTPQQANGFEDRLKEQFPQAGWRIRTPDNAAPGVENFVGRLALFLSFVGFTTLLIGGVGVSAGVRDYLNGKTATIATLKCLGASSSIIFKTYLVQITLISLIGISSGLLLGGAAPLLAAKIGSNFFPVVPQASLYPSALLGAAAFGILTVTAFAFWPLGRVQNVPASALFRDKIAPITADPARQYKVYSYISAGLLILLTLLTAHRLDFAIVFVVVAILVLLILKGAGHLTATLAQKVPHLAHTGMRLAIAALHRPGTTAPSVILSLGLGLSVLVAVTQIDQNLRGQISKELPEKAPTFFFIDIQSQQADAFDQAIAGVTNTAQYKRVPSLRGRITQIDGVDVDKVNIDAQSQWAVRGDRALTYAAQPAEGAKIVKGQWWEADYTGDPQISLDAGLAKGFGVDVGDTLTVNVLGRNVTATITSLRAINWKSLRFDFAIIMSPGLLEHAPHSHIAAVHADASAAEDIEARLAAEFPNVSIIRVEEALKSARTIMDGISTAIGVAASLTVMAGALVLAGAMASGRQQRIYEAVVFKVLGATRTKMLQAYLIEYSVLGLVTGVISAIVGSLAAWGVITILMEMDWTFHPMVVVLTLVICLILTVSAGFIGTWTALGEKASGHLRNE